VARWRCHCVLCSLVIDTQQPWVLNKMSMMTTVRDCVSAPTVSGKGSRGGRGEGYAVFIYYGPHIFQIRGPAWSKSGPGGGSVASRV